MPHSIYEGIGNILYLYSGKILEIWNFRYMQRKFPKYISQKIHGHILQLFFSDIHYISEISEICIKNFRYI